VIAWVPAEEPERNTEHEEHARNIKKKSLKTQRTNNVSWMEEEKKEYKAIKMKIQRKNISDPGRLPKLFEKKR